MEAQKGMTMWHRMLLVVFGMTTPARRRIFGVRFEPSRFLENCQFLKSLIQCDNDLESDDLSYGKVTGYERVTRRVG